MAIAPPASTAALQELGYSNVKAFPPDGRAKRRGRGEHRGELRPAPRCASAVDAEMLVAVADFLNNIPEGYYSIGTDVEKLQADIDAGATVDVRQPEEYEQARSPPSTSPDSRALAKNLDADPDRCAGHRLLRASGHRAAMSTAAAPGHAGPMRPRFFPPGYGGRRREQ
ncbi:MAG: hypothetical protein R2854_19490 [Caldilineaceae bacterium]